MGKVYALHEEVKLRLVGVTDKNQIREIIRAHQAKVEALIEKDDVSSKCDSFEHHPENRQR